MKADPAATSSLALPPSSFSPNPTTLGIHTFFEKFDLFADAPGAVAKMRELVLQLAVQGKLVAQDPNDEPAAEIIKRTRVIGLKNPRLTKAKKSADETTNTERAALPAIPRGWAWTCNVELGDTRPRNATPDESLVAFAPMNLVPTDYRAPLEFESRPWAEIKKGFTHFANGDIAVAKITPCFQNGKACVMANLIGGMGAGTTELHVLRPHSNSVVPLYMLLFFKSPEFVTGGVASFSGTASQQRVSNDYFRFRPIPLPPLAEQKRIVAKVDELMALCDRLEAQQQERETRHAALARASLARFADAPTPANLNFLFHSSFSIQPSDLRQSILTLAVQGKLVPQDPTDEPAEELLSRILTDNPRLRDSLRKPTEQAATGKGLAIIPESWVPVALGRVMKVTSSKRIFESEYADTGVPFFRSKEIGDLSRGEAIKTTLYISAVRYAELKQHTDCPKPGDLLLTSVGTIGNTWIVDDREFYFKDGNITQIIKTEGIEMRYVQIYIASPMFTDAVEQIVAGTAYNALTIIKIKGMIFPLPPLAEQCRIVAKVDQLMALVDVLETQIAASRATAAKLLDALVAELTAA